MAPGLVRCSSFTPFLGHGGSSTVGDPSAGSDHFGQSKIQNLGVTALGDEEIRRLDVAMNDAVGVRGIEGVGDFDGREPEQSSISIGRPAMRCFSVTPSRNSMAMKAWPSLLADVVNGADVGMVESGGGLGFALEAAESLRVSGDLVGQELQGDEAAELNVLGLVDDTHAAAAEFLDDAVVRDGLADQGERIPAFGSPHLTDAELGRQREGWGVTGSQLRDLIAPLDRHIFLEERNPSNKEQASKRKKHKENSLLNFT